MKKKQKQQHKSDNHIFQCPTCGTKYRLPNVAARRVQCCRCGGIFYDWYKPLLLGKGYDEFWNFKGRFCVCKGSRGSKKSKTAALWHIAHMMMYPEASTLVVRKTERTLKDSCFADLKWAIHRLGVDNEWKCTQSPLEITRISTGQKILFRGFDDPLKITSITVPYGCLCWVWCEEAYELNKEADFDTLNESIRGDIPDGYFKRFTITFNPWSDKHWLKKRFFDVPDSEHKLSMTTNYMCNEWLRPEDLVVFEDMKKNNPTRYRIAGLGDWGVAEGLVYNNWEEQDFDIEAIRRKPGIQAGFGLDFGFTAPAALCCFFLDESEKKMYIFDELYKTQQTNQQLAELITEMGYHKEFIVADCAESKSIAELYDAGLYNIQAALKGADSINYGIQLIQNYRVIVHPRCVNFITEISNYCWDEDRFGNKLDKPAKGGDHLMDAWRYGCASLLAGDTFSWD